MSDPIKFRSSFGGGGAVVGSDDGVAHLGRDPLADHHRGDDDEQDDGGRIELVAIEGGVRRRALRAAARPKA